MIEFAAVLFAVIIAAITCLVNREPKPKQVRRRRYTIKQPQYHGGYRAWPDTIKDEGYGVLESDTIELR